MSNLYINIITIFIVLYHVTNCSILPENCGKNLRERGNREWGLRIVGGQRSNVWEWPWMVNLNVEVGVSGQYVAVMSCGGTIVHENWILTAAHCVHRSTDPALYFAYLGYNDLDIKGPDQLRLSVEKVLK